MPANNAQAGVEAPANIQGKYVDLVTVTAGVIDVRYGNDAHQVISTNSIQLTPSTVTAGSVQWICDSAGGAIADKHLPAACR